MYLPVTNSFELSYFVYFHICVLPCCIVLSIAKMWSVMYPANSNKHLSRLDRSTPIFASVDHHGVQPTGCMDNEPEPSCVVPC